MRGGEFLLLSSCAVPPFPQTEESDRLVCTPNSTSSAFPYCRKYTTGIFSGFDCFSEAGEVDPLLPTPISGYSTLDFSSDDDVATTTTTGGLTASARQSGGAGESGGLVGGKSDAPVSATPFTQTQATASSGESSSETKTADSGSACVGGMKGLAGVLSLWVIVVVTL